MENKEI